MTSLRPALWRRFWQHLWCDERQLKQRLPTAAIERIEAHVRDSERHHAGEVCVCVEAGLPLTALWRQVSPRQRAIEAFSELRVWDTAGNNGVLIYLLMADRAVEIVADRGLNTLVPTTHWQAVVEALTQALQAHQFEAGLTQAVQAVDSALRTHFPATPGELASPNELPDRVVLRY